MHRGLLKQLIVLLDRLLQHPRQREENKNAAHEFQAPSSSKSTRQTTERAQINRPKRPAHFERVH
jgi:hypothetical protein